MLLHGILGLENTRGIGLFAVPFHRLLSAFVEGILALDRSCRFHLVPSARALCPAIWASLSKADERTRLDYGDNWRGQWTSNHIKEESLWVKCVCLDPRSLTAANTLSGLSHRGLAIQKTCRFLFELIYHG